MHPPRPASGDTIYIIHASVSNSMSMLVSQYSQLKRPSDLDVLILKVVSESESSGTWATSVSILVFLGLFVLDRPDVRHRQTDVK